MKNNYKRKVVTRGMSLDQRFNGKRRKRIMIEVRVEIRIRRRTKKRSTRTMNA